MRKDDTSKWWLSEARGVPFTVFLFRARVMTGAEIHTQGGHRVWRRRLPEYMFVYAELCNSLGSLGIAHPSLLEPPMDD